MKSFVIVAVSLLTLLGSHAAQGQKNTSGLDNVVQLLTDSEDPAFQLDVLKGLNDGLRSRRGVAMPAGWEPAAEKLERSPNAQVRELAQSLSVMFGSKAALEKLRTTLLDANAGQSARSNALASLLQVKDTELPPALHQLLMDQTMRGAALRSLAAYDDPKTSEAILAAYSSLTPSESRDALTTLSSRVPYAKSLLVAVSDKKVPVQDFTADILRQLRNLKDAQLSEQIARTWGVTRETPADKLRDIERYKKLVGAKGYGSAGRGRTVFNKNCQQCHTLYGEGGKVGPDITGSARGDLDYILSNTIDPNAVIPNDFRTWNLDTKDDRSITGVVTRQDDRAVTIVTANESLVIPRNEVQSLKQTELSLMPEGLLQALSEDDVRDLLAYLQTTAQVPAADSK